MKRSTVQITTDDNLRFEFTFGGEITLAQRENGTMSPLPNVVEVYQVSGDIIHVITKQTNIFDTVVVYFEDLYKNEFKLTVHRAMGFVAGRNRYALNSRLERKIDWLLTGQAHGFN